MWVPAGRFVMGSPEGVVGRDDDEGPMHEVRISRGYWLGKYEVTQGEWEAVMGENPSNFKECGSRCPVDSVSWEDVQEFTQKLNERESGSGNRYRLPTEAEWEYAARAGTAGARYGEVGEIAWYEGNSGGRTHPVGQKRANGCGVARHAGERVGVDGGLAREVSVWCGDGSGGSLDGLDPGASGRQLVQQREVRSVCESLRQLARRPLQQRRLPLGQDGVTLGPITLLPLAAQRETARAGRRRPGGGSDRAAPQGVRRGRWLAQRPRELSATADWNETGAIMNQQESFTSGPLGPGGLSVSPKDPSLQLGRLGSRPGFRFGSATSGRRYRGPSALSAASEP